MAKEPENTQTSLSQLEELSSNMLRSIDILHQDVEVIKDYTVQNNKFVHALQVRMGDLDEKFEKFLERSSQREKKVDAELVRLNTKSNLMLDQLLKDQKLRDMQMEELGKRLEKLRKD